jgi:hypothetical protein
MPSSRNSAKRTKYLPPLGPQFSLISIMKNRYLTPVLALIVLTFSGCGMRPDAEGKKQANLLGIVKYEQASFQHTSPTSITLASEEMLPRGEYSGDKVTFLWGLITLKDY